MIKKNWFGKNLHHAPPQMINGRPLRYPMVNTNGANEEQIPAEQLLVWFNICNPWLSWDRYSRQWSRGHEWCYSCHLSSVYRVSCAMLKHVLRYLLLSYRHLIEIVVVRGRPLMIWGWGRRKSREGSCHYKNTKIVFSGAFSTPFRVSVFSVTWKMIVTNYSPGKKLFKRMAELLKWRPSLVMTQKIPYGHKAH